MRNDKLIPGTILVIIGTAILLEKLGVLHLNWVNAAHLWPVLLILAGIILVFSQSRSGWATFFKIIALVVGLVILFGTFTYNSAKNWNLGFDNHYDMDDNDYTDNNSDTLHRDSIIKVEGNGVYTSPYNAASQSARLNISGGATTYNLNGITNQLFEAETKEYKNRYTLSKSMDGTTQVLDFSMNNHNRFPFQFNNKSNHADIKLNTNPQWEINLAAGAAKIDFDLSNFKIKKLKIDGGAASFHIKMGQPLVNTNIEVSTGASSVIISIPQNAACHIITDTGLSSKSFDGFQNQGDNEYATPNFDKAPYKMYVHLEGGISDFKVSRY